MMKKRLIFIWINNSQLQNENKGIVLSGKYDIDLQFSQWGETTAFVNIKRLQEYVDDFWGDNISDIMALVGENGSGKTVLCNEIMYIMKKIEYLQSDQVEYFVLYEDVTNNKFYYDGNIEVKGNDLTLERLDRKEPRMISAYFHNALSRNDYFAQKEDYDFSLGAKIRRNREHAKSMHYYNLERDSIALYYSVECRETLEFIYEYKEDKDKDKKLKLPIRLPKYVRIDNADMRYNNDMIKERLKNDPKGAETFAWIKGWISKWMLLGQTQWIVQTIQSILVNCFKFLCVSQTTSSNAVYTPEEFAERGKRAEGGNNIIEWADNILEKMAEGAGESGKNYIKKVRDYIRWIQDNQNRIEQYQYLNTLRVPVSKSTEEFVFDLLTLSEKLCFEFPFYDWSFDMSTGEMYFLSIFKDLAKLKKRLEEKVGVSDVLLIFDELDSSMHPKWQRNYIKWLVDVCSDWFEKYMIQIIVTTHSPIILSDFPADSVIYIEKRVDDQKSIEQSVYYRNLDKKTFGLNIDTLFLDAFFLEDKGTVGAFAEQTINATAREIMNKQDDYDREGRKRRERNEKIINHIGEGIIKTVLENKIGENGRPESTSLKQEQNKIEKNNLKETLYTLEEQRKRLDEIISNIKYIVEE